NGQVTIGWVNRLARPQASSNSNRVATLAASGRINTLQYRADHEINLPLDDLVWPSPPKYWVSISARWLASRVSMPNARALLIKGTTMRSGG
ncbi:hypothetical protein, partial [Mesorhizobium sp. M1C.F.Ca.ET.188.01.1.1]|uniref:hypothetical protein n=1 Tax=Mesorhizobium sp. M1C.F.Ca.ET.188.01.1.1 TaxID=2563924 RepID=UPI001AEE2177